MTYELSWNLMKDYLEYQGFSDVRYPRESVKQAFASGLITDGHLWMELIKDRKLTSHTYNETQAAAIEGPIRSVYFPLFEKLNKTFAKLDE